MRGWAGGAITRRRATLPGGYPPAMTPTQARTARWITVVVLAVAVFTVIALGQSMWWVALFLVLLVILSFVFGRYEAGADEDAGPT
jgi:Flp pilus assembly protein TadB